MKKVLRGMKNSVKGYNEAERLVRECTCDEEGPPPPRVLRQVANMTHNDIDTYKKIWTLLWGRTKHFQYIRHVQRGLQTIEFLLVNGNERIIQDVEDQILTIKRLTTYKYYKDGNKDIAEDVRKEAARLLGMMKDRPTLMKQRATAAENRKKFSTGISGFGSATKTQNTQTNTEGEIRTVYKWQNSEAMPEDETTEPGAEEPKKKKKKKKEKKKHKDEPGEASPMGAADDFDAFPDIEFDQEPSEPAKLEALEAPRSSTKNKKQQNRAPAPSQQADFFDMGMPSVPAEPVPGQFSFGDEAPRSQPQAAPSSGADDWIAQLSQPQPTTTNTQNLFDDVFSQPVQDPNQQEKITSIFFDTPAKPQEPPAPAAPPQVTKEPQKSAFYEGVVNTDDIFGTAPKTKPKRQPGNKPAKTMAQLAKEKEASQLMSNMGNMSMNSQQKQNDIFTQINPPQPANPFGAPNANPFGAAAAPQQPQWGQGWGQPQPAAAQAPAWGAAAQPMAQPMAQPFPASAQQQPWGQQQQAQPNMQANPNWGANPHQNLYQGKPQQQQNPFDTLSWN